MELQDEQLLAEIVHAAQCLVIELQLEKEGYSLLVNGGQYQDVNQLHFHLISDG